MDYASELATTDNRFWNSVDIQTDDLCWNWKLSTNRGYGQLRRNKKQLSAHRYAYELTFGPISSEQHVLHKCDNPKCCNPSHLFIGNQQDNMADKLAKGRQKRGSEHHLFGKKKIHSEETKEKIRLWNTGKKRSPEARKAMSDARLRYFASKKEVK